MPHTHKSEKSVQIRVSLYRPPICADFFWCGDEIILQIEGLFQEKCVILNFNITHEN